MSMGSLYSRCSYQPPFKYGRLTPREVKYFTRGHSACAWWSCLQKKYFGDINPNKGNQVIKQASKSGCHLNWVLKPDWDRYVDKYKGVENIPKESCSIRDGKIRYQENAIFCPVLAFWKVVSSPILLYQALLSFRSSLQYIFKIPSNTIIFEFEYLVYSTWHRHFV